MMGAIFAQLAELNKCAQEMKAALEVYKDAVDEAQAAAQALGEEWKGAARDAFIAEQEKAYKSHGIIENTIREILRSVQEVIAVYRETDSKVQNGI